MYSSARHLEGFFVPWKVFWTVKDDTIVCIKSKCIDYMVGLDIFQFFILSHCKGKSLLQKVQQTLTFVNAKLITDKWSGGGCSPNVLEGSLYCKQK